MAKHIKEVDSYIENAKPFAQIILKHIRKLVHQGCPEVEESIKWNFPHFSYKGLLCSMAAFSEHCAFGFWKGGIMPDPHHILDKERTHAMGHLGRLTRLEPVQNLRSDDLCAKICYKLTKIFRNII